jgi:tetratricopeptide (TPR) repeat protein
VANFALLKHPKNLIIMKRKVVIALCLSLVCQFAVAQSIDELYNNRDFQGLIKYAENADSLTGEELFQVGYAFFQLEDDMSAIKMYDKAIEKGHTEDYIYLYKGLSYRYNNQSDKAIEFFKLAIEKNPQGQKNHTELGNSFYFQEKYDEALVHFYNARELSYELGDPYLKIPNIYHLKEDYEKALEEYRISAKLINKGDPTYLELLKGIGLLEYTVFNRYEEAINAYLRVIKLMPSDYDVYPKLIKAYYANEEFEKGDSLFNILKVEYEKGNLPEFFQKYGHIPIAEFEWNQQTVIVYKYFKEPTETLDLMYEIYLVSKDGQTLERRLMTEKTIQLDENSAKHLLCERERDGTHHTYAYGWATDDIEFNSLKEAAIAVFNKELNPSASSNFAPTEDKKSKKKKKGRKKKGQ